MSSQASADDNARAKRLAGLFRHVLKGDRKIQSANDAKLFLEATRAQAPASSCIEEIVASKHGIEALQLAVRLDLGPVFIKDHTLRFIDFLADEQLKLLADGQILHVALMAISKPPTLWNALVSLANAGAPSALEGDGLKAFAWLSLELLSLPSSADLDVNADVESVTQGGSSLVQSSDLDIRRLGYKIQNLLRLRKAPTSRTADSYVPGGRHDNDFEDFRKIATYPTADEFLSTERPFYRRVKEVFDMDMSERAAGHLDNIYRLTREDLLGELRNDWQNAQDRKKGKRSALTLGGLWPVGLELGDEKFMKKCCLAITCKTGLGELEKKQPDRRKNWLKDNNNFLRHHAFGALYRGKEIFGFAFVERNVDALLLNPPVITLRFADDKAFSKALLALKTPQDLMFALVDTPVFAYEPVLDRLKDMNELPLQDKLLNPSESVDDFDPHPSLQKVIESLASSHDKPTGVQFRLRIGAEDKRINLDSSQRQSLLNALSLKVSVIQGPPGTGKSFIGALAAHFIARRTKLKIMVITYTNHALDQFLEDLLDLGIDGVEMVRLGSKSISRTAPFLLGALRSEFQRTQGAWKVIDALKTEARDLSEELREAIRSYLRPRASFVEIQEYLEFSEDGGTFYEAFIVPSDEDGFEVAGKKGKPVRPDYLFDRWVSGSGPGAYRQEGTKSIWHIAPPERLRLMSKWLSAILQDKVDRVHTLAQSYDHIQSQMDDQFSQNKVHTLREKRVIGCTTTAAAMYSKLLEAAQPDLVIVEEAGEIQESHILTALTSSVKQLVLIGDHKQLRPKINNYNLTVEKGEGYDLNRSLFERLILQGHPHTTLRKQHRMHPDISILVRELTYPDLEDDPKTEQRDALRGLEDRVVFVNHTRPEEQAAKIADRRDQGSTFSKENVFEAQMVLKIVKYLAQQGYTTKNMVVLTPYLGQLRLVRDMLLDEVDPILSDLDAHELIQAGLMTKAAAKVDKSQLRISTIDNYQGEEADIVIVSLTRSNSEGDIGFLAARERLNVLLSRARNSLIMIGNMETYMQSKRGGDTWRPFFESMKAKNHLYDGLPVHCEKHPEKRFLLKEPADFDRCCPDGGCAEDCGIAFNCGLHHCKRRCHRVAEHSKIPCTSRVENTCDRGHKAKVPCHTRMEKCLKCVHDDQEAERRMRRDLKLEADRLTREEAYKKELAKIQDTIDHHRRTIKYHQDEQNRQNTLAQQKADLASLKDTAARILNAPKPESKSSSTMPGSFPPADLQTPPDPSDSNGLRDGAKQEWEHLKQFEGDKSDAMDELMSMIGLEEVKQSFLGIKDRVDTAIRQGISLQKERFSCSMLGNPGVGKTTVARLYAKFLTSIGVIPGSCFKEETGASLANAGVSGCKKLIETILNDGGGVLFIDEAYQLTSGNSHGGAAVLDYLLPEVENLSGKIVFVLAGYNKNMESFFAHNPGLPSRFPVDMKFEDYTDEELLNIFALKIHKKYDGRMKCEDGTRGLYCRIATRRVGRSRGRDGFGNARTIENTLATVTQRQAARLKAERRAGAKDKVDDFLLTKEDLIGPEPTGALKKSKAWRDLQKLIGLTSVKDAVRALVDSVTENYQRELNEQPPMEFTLNKVFLGNPGTGKTTVAKLYGSILVDLGMLSKGEVVVKNPSDFVGSVLGESEKLTKGILASTLGKVLVIDEAYGLCGNAGSNADPYKTAVIDTIVAEVQSVPGDDRCVLLLGYRDQMENMLQNVNPGLSRRFPIASAFEFEDFEDDELQKILDLKLKQTGFGATDQAKATAREILSRARNRPNFGNAGEIDNMLNDAKARRMKRRNKRPDSIFEARDFDENFDRAERADTDVGMLFKDTVGNEEVVSLLKELQADVKGMKKLGIDPRENIPFNFLFKGPPGTGKTTTAKKMGKVFYDMGFLATDKVIECSATDLIGQYIGQTGPKVLQQLDKALGQVLFIDEAYRLGEGHFSKEAMDEIVDATTKDKYAKKMIIILAGYEQDINRLMRSNPGLTSRFPQAVNFRSLTPDECLSLLTQDLTARKAKLSDGKNNLDLSALEDLTAYSRGTFTALFHQLSQQDSWASARDVKEVATAIFRKGVKSVKNGCVTITIEMVDEQLRSMLQERSNRSQHVHTSLPMRPSLLQEPTPQLSPSSRDPGTSVAASTATALKPPTPEPEHPEAPTPGPEVLEVVDKAKSTKKLGIRDAGVSDEVWDQLQRDSEAEEQREQEYHDLLKAQQTAREEDRLKIVKRLLEEEERRKKEEEARKKLDTYGMCPAGYQWIKQPGGYRCGGGSHYMSEAALEQL